MGLDRRDRRRLGLSGALACCLALAIGLASVPVQASTPPLFGSREIRKDDLKPFPKWTGSLERFVVERTAQKGCKPTATNKCPYAVWGKFMRSVKDDDPIAKIDKVNRFMNQARYIVDPINWGVKDYWETPAEFFAKFGDCEDYAIAKFLTLRALGFKGDSMRIVIVQDLNLKVAHAVLAVYLDDTIKILDNQIKQVVEAGTIRHYRPIYSVNEESWWLHR